MQQVADHLREFACSPNLDSSSRDDFARSSYNRYYWACYLHVTRKLFEMNENWSNVRHQKISRILLSQVSKELYQMKLQARRLKDTNFASQIDIAIESTKEVAKIFEVARTVRVNADYNFEDLVVFKNPYEYSLNDISITMAKEWISTITSHLQNVNFIWKQRDD